MSSWPRPQSLSDPLSLGAQSRLCRRHRVSDQRAGDRGGAPGRYEQTPQSVYSCCAGRLPSRSLQRCQTQVRWLSEGEELAPGPCLGSAQPTSTPSAHGESHTHPRSCRGGGWTAPKTMCPSPHPQHLNVTLFGKSLC